MVSLQWTLFGTSTGGLQQVYYTIQHKLPVILEAFQASSCLTMPNFAHVFLTYFSASIIDIRTWWNWICSLLKLTGLQKYGHNQQIYYLFAGLVYLGNVGESGILKNKTKKQNNDERTVEPGQFLKHHLMKDHQKSCMLLNSTAWCKVLTSH